MRIPERIKAPSLKEFYVLRFMILAGLASMVFLLYNLLKYSVIDNAFLYWLLIIALLFTCLKILHEWYHYFYIIVPNTPALTKKFTVDIFTTFCPGEPYQMMLETLTAIQAIKYPHTTYLCDEADDPYLKNLCKELGIHHITRTEKINAKAGNINNALKHASGDLCVVLDPDHVPFPNFLDPIVSHFNDPKVGFVQIVQAYKNFHEGLIAKGAAQQTFQFYGPMMMTMNKYGTVLAIGANCTFRRAALDSIGGHAAGLAEDMHTAMQLHAKGWKSVYVPEVLARGLVPSTLSAYYSQQLKWSRGVFELLVTSYPKLFRKFTWRQKLHYGIIPFYYLSGIIFLINFLIPVLSLLFEVNPLKMDFETFLLIGFPLVVQITLIRNYVQRWVMEDEERGFHIVGGLLAIGTWWIFITGLIYTIVRKKVPYVPTPKDANEENNWPLNIPNLIVLLISLFAIGYGLYIDWNPYTFIMAGLAGINCLILLFNIAASRQVTFRKFKENSNFIRLSARYAFNARQVFWKMRIKAYAGIRSVALLLTLLTIGTTVYMIQARSSELTGTDTPLKKKDFFLTGIFAPETNDGLSSVRLIDSYQVHFDIISLYIPWGNSPNSNLPMPLIDSIYHAGSLPMITWEPWQNLFNGRSETFKDVKVLKRIANGDYDNYLADFAQQIRNLHRPVYIRFAHEFDNPFYPWSNRGGNTPEDFKRAWKYVHRFFQKEGAYNAVWVWNPWKPEAVKDYFPGKSFVDWIGITTLNYGQHGPDKKWYSLEQLYTPFRKYPIVRSGIPVMLAEMGSLKSAGHQREWFEDSTIAVKRKFPEIKAVVLFNSGLDKNIPTDTNIQYLDWRVQDPNLILTASRRTADINAVPRLSQELASPIRFEQTGRAYIKQFDTIRGVNYSKGLNWVSNYNILRHREIVADFKEMKELGFNTIKRYGPGIYDDNILSAAKQQGLQIKFGFYVPDKIDFLKDRKVLDKLDNTIIATIEKYKNDNSIIGWNLGNTPLQKLHSYYEKPELLYQQYAYAEWLKRLLARIKQEDPTRPISIDLEVTEKLHLSAGFLINQVPEIDAFSLVVHERSPSDIKLSQLGVPYFIGKIHAASFFNRRVQNEGFFIADWQDQEQSNLVTFDGLKDNWGKNKVYYNRLKNRFQPHLPVTKLPKVKILRPAATVYEQGNYKYHALVDVNNEWKVAESLKSGLTYNWYLVKVDAYGNGISMKYISTGPSVSVKIPGDPRNYHLYLNASRGNAVTTALSTLNIPLVIAESN